jgi:protein phosphatase
MSSTTAGSRSGHGRGAPLDADIELGAATDTGRVRSHNEDAFFAGGRIAAVADGMGGHAAGDVAAARAIEALASINVGTQVHSQDILAALGRANDAILAEVAQAPDKAGMGTTVTGVALVDHGGSPHWIVFNIGDSRVYRVADGEATQLTVDHSEVAELVALGRITAQEAAVHPLRNIITRSLGTTPAPVPDHWMFPMSPRGDTFVACSDGLTNEVDDAVIAAVVSASDTPADAAASLVAHAMEAGGRDNITVVVLRSSPGDAEGEWNTAPRPIPEEGRR